MNESMSDVYLEMGQVDQTNTQKQLSTHVKKVQQTVCIFVFRKLFVVHSREKKTHGFTRDLKYVFYSRFFSTDIVAKYKWPLLNA